MAQFLEAIAWTASCLDDMIPTSHARGPILATDTECITFWSCELFEHSHGMECGRMVPIFFVSLMRWRCFRIDKHIFDTGGGLHVHKDDVALVVGDLDASEGIQDIAIKLLQCVQQSHPCTFFGIIGATVVCFTTSSFGIVDARMFEVAVAGFVVLCDAFGSLACFFLQHFGCLVIFFLRFIAASRVTLFFFLQVPFQSQLVLFHFAQTEFPPVDVSDFFWAFVVEDPRVGGRGQAPTICLVE